MKIQLLLFFICMGTFSYAQQTKKESYPSNRRDPKWFLDMTAGANIDLIRSGSSPESKLLGSRPSKDKPRFGCRIHLSL